MGKLIEPFILLEASLFIILSCIALMPSKLLQAAATDQAQGDS